MPLLIETGNVKVLIRYGAPKRLVEVRVGGNIFQINLDTLKPVSIAGPFLGVNLTVAIQQVRTNYAYLDYMWYEINP